MSHDPFPKTGLTKQYEPFIREWVFDFCKQYPSVAYDRALIEAVKISIEFEPKFKPELGYDFSTPLRHHLKGLYRILVESEEKCQGVHTETEAQRIKREAEEKNTPTRALDFSGGANGARLTWDLQLGARFDDQKRPRIFFGIPLRSATEGHARGVQERVSRDLSVLLDNSQPGEILKGQMRALLAHQERRQREDDQEAENRQGGSYEPVFLKPSSVTADVVFYKGGKRPDFKPTFLPHVSLDEPYTHEDGSVGKLSDTIADGSPESAEQSAADEARFQEQRGAVATERLSLDPRDAAVFDQRLMLNRPVAEVAAKVGMTKGGVSKAADRIVRTIANRLNDE